MSPSTLTGTGMPSASTTEPSALDAGALVGEVVEAVPDLGTGWLLLALAPLLLAAVALLTAGRWPQQPAARTVRWVSLGSALLSALGVVGTALHRPAIDLPWIPEIGMRLQLAPDGLSIPLLLLTSLMGVVATALHLHADHPANGQLAEAEDQPSVDEDGVERTAPIPVLTSTDVPGLATYHACLLLTVLGALTAFLAGDALVFFVGFELVLIPMWVLVDRYGDPSEHADRGGAATRFLLVTVVGSSLMLVGLLAVATATGTTDLSTWASDGTGLSTGAQTVVAAILLTGLALKIPVFPLHTWLPWVHATAPTAGSVLLASVLLKLGTYGIVRLVVPVLPEGFAAASPLLAGLAVTGIVWASLACLAERDLKRLIAWSSIAHLGFVVLGLATGSEAGLQAALFGNVAHGLIAALLFVVVGGLKHRWGSGDLRVVRAALRETSPRLGAMLALGAAATMGLPGLAGFWGEIGSLLAAWSPAPDRAEWWFRGFAVVAAVGGVLAAAYVVRMLREAWSGDRTEPSVPDATRTEMAVLRLLAAGVILLGVWPTPLLEVTAPVVRGVIGR